ncbi:hypothetical protein IGI39_004902 [Enterococcus sp. AZ135]|uniref:terminase small subunit n=1 Tax=unclassified Enterococcus TaxID=2608891 RepID=UPI003F29C6ED
MEKREVAFKLYKESNGEKPLIEIAKEIDASPGTVRGWKSRYKWDESLGIKPSETKRSVTRNVTKDATPKLVIDNDDLTEQQKMFCLFYLQHFNATKAYQQAYQCDYNTANANGSRLLVKASVKEELRHLKAELQQEQFFTIQDIIADYAKQWKADINDVITSDRKRTKAVDGKGQLVKDENGEQVYLYYNTITAKNSDEFDGQLVKEISQGRDGVSVKLHDKQKAMNELMKYLIQDAESDSNNQRVVITRSKRGDTDG